MDRGLKERLVGAAVIIAIGVWLIPLVLDGPDSDPADDNARLTLPAASEPAPVRTQTIHLDEPEPAIADIRRDPVSVDVSSTPDSTRAPAQADSRADTASAPASQTAPTIAPPQPDSQSASAAAEREPEPQTPPSPAATEPPRVAPAAAASVAPGDFLVQLGSFGEAENARRLAERVSTYGYTADISPHRAGGRTMHRVRVGPYETRARAEAAMSALTAHGFVAQVVVADSAGQ